MRLLPAVLACLLVPSAFAAPSKHLTGVVTGPNSQPLDHASVKMQNSRTHQVTSRITGHDGRYTFNRVPNAIPLTLWATWKGHRSSDKYVTRYNTDKDVDIDLQIDTQ